MKRDLLLFFAFSLLVMMAPQLFEGGYLMNVLVFVGINTMLAIALNLLLGYAGQISLGHAGFFGLGAYLSGILTTTYGLNPWVCDAGRSDSGRLPGRSDRLSDSEAQRALPGHGHARPRHNYLHRFQ